MNLEYSIVKRGGATAPTWYGETREIRCSVVPGGLEFFFSMPSKGGGTTDVQFELSFTDLPVILKAVAAEHTFMAATLAEATLIAITRGSEKQRNEAAP